MGSRYCHSRGISDQAKSRHTICSHPLSSIQRAVAFGQVFFREQMHHIVETFVTIPCRQPRYSFKFCYRHLLRLCWTHHVSLKRTALPRALPSAGITLLRRYYGPSDFLTAVPASSLTRLVSRYSDSLENRQDLPRSPICFSDMPCSQTPGTPLATAHPVASDVVFWKIDAIDHPTFAS